MGNLGMRMLLAMGAAFLVLLGCASMMQGQGSLQSQGQSQEKVAFTLDDRYNDGAVTIKVIGFDRRLLSATGVILEIANTGEAGATVKWSKSTIGQGSDSARPFLDGMAYENAGLPAPDERIKASSSTRRTLYPSYNVVDTDRGKRLESLQAAPLVIKLCVEVLSKERYYTINVDLSGKS
jgi:hypothetical protein